MTLHSVRSLAAAATLSFVLFGGVGAALAQTRLQAIDAAGDAQRTPLTGAVSPRALAAEDLGPVAADKVLPAVTLRFNLSAAQSMALDQLLANQQNPASPQYHQWLTPEQFADRFGLSPADLATVSGWLRSQGLTITAVSRSRTFVTVSGTAAQVQAAFQTPIHQVQTNGNLHFANLSAPTLPAPIAKIVGTITGLDDFRLKPHNRAHTEPAPQFTSSVSGNHFIAPGDFYTIYDVNPLLKNSIDGSGVTIAVMGQADLSLADVAAFRSASGLAAKAPTVQLVGADPGTPAKPDDTIEAQLDVEWAGAVAPNANILYVNSKDAFGQSLLNSIDKNVAPILTISYGNCETGFQYANVGSYHDLFRQANAQGQTIVSAAGDSGATDCDYQVASAGQGLAVDFPASSPEVTGLGGLMFNEGSGSYFNATNGAGSGSAISYIPEMIWNETGTGNLAAGGGGSSGYFTKPSWQTGTGVPNDFSRDVPDVSLNAAAGHDGYLYCAQGFCTNGYRDAAGNLDVVGGTSVAAPSFAGILALLEQKTGSRLGNANPTIYGLAASTYGAAVFHDTTTGSNTSPCTAGTANCPSGGSIGYNAGSGYDLASGWGSVDAFNLVNDWSLVQPAGTGSAAGQNDSATTMSPASSSVSIGTSISYTIAVGSGTTGLNTTPTGTVQLLIDNAPVGSATSLTNGAAALSLSTAGVSAGTHVVTAAYSGDAVYAGSKATASLDLTSTTSPDFSLTPASATATAKSGSAAPGISFAIAALSGFSGSVTLSAAATSAVTGSYAFSVSPVTLVAGGTTNTVLTLYATKAVTGTTALASTGKGSVAQFDRTGGAAWLPLGSGVAVAGLLLFGLPRRRTVRWSALAVALFASALFTMTGCGTGSGTATTATSTANSANALAGTYTVVVTAAGADSSGKPISHTATVSFVVQ